MSKPRVILPDHENAFILLMRARRALRESNTLDLDGLAIFDELVNRDLILRTPTCITPKWVYSKLYDEVAARCTLVIGSGAKPAA